MDNNSDRFNFKDCSQQKVGEFILAIEKSKSFIRKEYIPINDKSHFERFYYALGNEKISIVYDTKGKILTLTAKNPILSQLVDIYNGKNVDIKITDTTQQISVSENNMVKQPVQANQPNAQKPQQTNQPNAQKPVQTNQPNAQKPAQKARTNDAQKAKNLEAKRADFGTSDKKSEPKNAAKKIDKNSDKKTDKNVQKTTQKDEPLEYKNGFSIKGYTLERLEAVLKRIKSIGGSKVKPPTTELLGGTDELKTYEIIDSSKQKVYLRYMPAKKSLSLQGKRSNLFSEIQLLVYKGSDFNTAIASHIELTGDDSKASSVEKRLKKLIPNGFEFLSEQSKIDFTIGMIDIYNEETKLSDYSVLLVPPFRGLERLIYDLQIAENINVKMIGQGFEKNDSGQYCIKAGYKKRINSIIYNEVLSALYTEYFNERNFYAHSDNSLNSFSRAIREKSEAKQKFDNLLSVIEYNCKKLKEIRFSIDKNSK